MKKLSQKEKNNKGITLIALVITIIVLLILAGISILALTKDGIVKKSEQAGLQTKLKEIEEIAQISYIGRKIDEITQGTEATFAGVINDLKLRGYHIEQRVNNFNDVNEIILSDNEIIMGKNTTQTLSCTFTYKTEKSKYFVKVQNNYYEIKLENEKISVNPNKIDLDKINQSNSITVNSSDQNLLEIEIVEKNNEIILKSNDTVGETKLTIKEKNSGKEITCTIHVKIPATALNVSPTNVVILKGNTSKITANVTPTNTTEEITWSSSDTNITTVSKDGVVSGMKNGTAVITATCGTQSAQCSVIVAEPGSAATITRDMYGKVVTDYSMMGKTWEIYYANANNIYLITRERVEDPIYGQRKLIDIVSTGTYSEGSTMLTNKERFPAAEEWLYVWNNSKYTSTYPNMQATLFMLDSKDVWNNSYRNSVYADYAIGSPTAELFYAAFNGNTNWKPKSIDSEGYRIWWFAVWLPSR